MRAEHHTTSNHLLPRTWWNSEETRREDLSNIKNLLDRQENAWNAMLYYWKRQPGATDVPPPSPPARTVGREEVIQRFP